MKSPIDPLGKVEEYFYRVEFQKRGSPHLHCLIWIKDAPIFDKAKQNHDEVTAFVDKYMTCSKLLPIQGMKESDRDELIKRQCHRHSRTCPKKDKVCRFNYPKPPFDKTTLLCPMDHLTEGSTKEERVNRRNDKNNFKKIEQTLNNWDKLPNTFRLNTMSDFLDYFKMSKEDYINAIRTSITTETVFLKRHIDERWINNYNPATLAVWEANTDIQYIVNGYAAASYILDYVTKGERGLSETLRQASKEAAFRQLSQSAALKNISSAFLNFVETGAQEAAYYLLGLPLHNSSHAVVFINTSDSPTNLVKPESEWRVKDDDDDDIALNNALDRYEQRPDCLRRICLAEFVASYDGLKTGKPVICKPDNENFIPEKVSDEVDDDKDVDDPQVATSNGLNVRLRPRIIRSVNYNMDTNPEDRCRELLMLFYPFRKLSSLKGDCSSYVERYDEVKESVIAQQNIFEKYRAEFQNLENESAQPEEDDNDNIANLAPTSVQDTAENLLHLQEAEACLPRPKKAPILATSKIYRQDDEWSDFFFDEELASLTKPQFQFILNFLSTIKKRTHGEGNQIMWFLTGGAGVGKTKTTKVLFEAARKYYNRLQNQDHSKIRVVKCAFSGKAAHQVGGYTIHSLFKLPFGGSKVENFSGAKLADCKEMLGDLEILIIDEISMVNNDLFSCMDHRLRAIKSEPDIPFGGVHVLCVGDLFQLPPTQGENIWNVSKPYVNPYTKKKLTVDFLWPKTFGNNTLKFLN